MDADSFVAIIFSIDKDFCTFVVYSEIVVLVALFCGNTASDEEAATGSLGCVIINKHFRTLVTFD